MPAPKGPLAVALDPLFKKIKELGDYLNELLIEMWSDPNHRPAYPVVHIGRQPDGPWVLAPGVALTADMEKVRILLSTH